jgi:uncharacterized membrane protein
VVKVVSELRRTAAPTRIRALAVIGLVVCALVALALAFMTFMEVSMAGFPDGHVTDYDRAVEAPLTLLAWVEVGLGLLFAALAFSPIGTRVRAAGLLITLIVFVVVALVAQFGVAWYFGTHLGLDNGVGG